MDIQTLFKNLNAETIRGYVRDGQEEHLSLDFKLVSKADLSTKGDRKTLAKAMSGFANSSGGLIIWGVNARKGPDGIDHAIEEKPVAPLSLFVSKLNEFTGQAVSPIVDNVEHRALPISSDRGFAVTIVPPSDSGPHMAKAGEDRYYKRSGDSFYRMEHFDIADMFGRRRRPRLALVHHIRRGGQMRSSGTVTHDVRVVLAIANTGRGPAKAPYLSLRFLSRHSLSEYGVNGNGSEGLPRLASSGVPRQYRFGASTHFLIHPGTTHEVAALSLKVRDDSNDLDDVQIEYEVVAEDVQMTRESLTIAGSEILKHIGVVS